MEGGAGLVSTATDVYSLAMLPFTQSVDSGLFLLQATLGLFTTWYVLVQSTPISPTPATPLPYSRRRLELRAS